MVVSGERVSNLVTSRRLQSRVRADAPASLTAKGPTSRRLLTRADEQRLGRAVQAGLAAQARVDAGTPEAGDDDLVVQGREATAHFVEANTLLARSRAAKVRSVRGVEEADVLQAALCGVFAAVKAFDPERGFKFSTYAIWWIDKHVRAAVDASRTIRVPSGVLEEARRVSAGVAEIMQRSGTETVVDDLLVDHVGVSGDRARFLQALPRVARSLDAPVGFDDGSNATTVGDTVADDGPFAEELAGEALAAEAAVAAVTAAVAELPEREAWLVRERFGLGGQDPRPVRELAVVLGVSENRVRQLLTKSASRLRWSVPMTDVVS